MFVTLCLLPRPCWQVQKAIGQGRKVWINKVIMKQSVVSVAEGRIQGKWSGDGKIVSFKGIPYAEPPVGGLRWKAPQPALKWEGIKKAISFSKSAWQQEIMLPSFLEALIDGQGWGKFRRFWVKTLLKAVPKPKQSEDCLYLNIKTPSLEKSAKLPVMVWIHGGDHQDGSSSEVYYDGAAIPSKGIVLVTINYRLGLLGYFAHPDLSKESTHHVSGNYGTLDQIAALKWVKENIVAFGGDPNNITIFGESAGGESVAHMLTSPLASGLFHKAIMQSPANAGQGIPLSKSNGRIASAESSGIQFTKDIGITGDAPIEQLRKLPAKDLMNLLRQQEDLNSFYPVIDGYVLPQSPFTAFYEQTQKKVPILLGSNADEGTCLYPMFTAPIIDYKTMSPEQMTEAFHKDFKEDVTKLYALYPGLKERRSAAEIALLGDDMFGAKVRFYAEYASKSTCPVYLYHFRRVPPNRDQTAGAFHAAELPFVHGTDTPVLPLNDQDKHLSKKMINYWTSFAKTGNPNNGYCPKWKAFDANTPQWMVLNRAKIEMKPIDREGKYELLLKRTIRQIKEQGFVEEVS